MLETLDSEIIQRSRRRVWIQPWPFMFLFGAAIVGRHHLQNEAAQQSWY